ncbi:MAG: rhomboid family intramembrane serine protease [Flavobacteriales bacterium]|nr:rhomboid family intramembrane serine protease [Flavobacteriales bacterium]
MITYIIIAITAIVSIRAFNDQHTMYKLMFNPVQVAERKEWWRVLSHGIIHRDWMHLIFNMLVLYFFGPTLETTFSAPQYVLRYDWVEPINPIMGFLFYVLLYVGGIAFAVLPAMRKHQGNPNYWSLGASGAVSAIIIAYVILFPLNELYLYFAIPIKAWIFGILFFVYESYMNRRGGSGIAHDAHLFGAVWGLIMVALLNTKYYAEFVNQILSYFQ